MTLTSRTLDLTDDDRRAAELVNGVMALLPRVRADGWRLAWGQRLNGPISQAAAALSATDLKRRGVQVADLAVPGPGGPVALRVLEPSARARALVVDIHGGGWVVGSAALNDGVNAHLVEAGLAVVSVDYRLLDESRVWIPDAVADCAAALRWALDGGRAHFGVEDVFVVGESAGAHLAALAALSLDPGDRARLAGCIFIQGVFDLSGSPSVRAAGPDCLLFDGPTMCHDLGRLTPGRDEAGRRLPDVSPLYADLHGAPPALFVTGERDPLRDDGRLMAEAWARHADVLLLDVPTAPHGFQHFGSPATRLVQAEIRAWIAARRVGDALSVDNPAR